MLRKAGPAGAALVNNRPMELIFTLADSLIPGLGSHLIRVGQASERVAIEMELPASDIEMIGRAGLYHDIGKMTWPEHIRHGAPRDNRDREIIYSHPMAGADLLAASDGLKDLAPAVRHHHERYDGAGLPDNLIGEEIPLGARIISVCDTADAITMHRHYDPARPQSEMLNILAAVAGSQLDPEVVAVYRRLAESGEIVFEQ